MKKITVDAKAFAEAMNKVSRVLKKSAIPILEEIAVSFEGVDKAYAIQAGREIRVMVKPDEVNDAGMKVIARDMAKKIKEEVKYPGQIKVNLIRESRAVDYAK